MAAKKYLLTRTPEKMQALLAAAYGLEPWQVRKWDGPNGLGWYIRSFGQQPCFIGSNGDHALLTRRLELAWGRVELDPNNARHKATYDRLAARLRAMELERHTQQVRSLQARGR